MTLILILLFIIALPRIIYIMAYLLSWVLAIILMGVHAPRFIIEAIKEDKRLHP